MDDPKTREFTRADAGQLFDELASLTDDRLASERVGQLFFVRQLG